MRKCVEHQTLVHLDVHVCPVFVCVCVGGGGVLSFIYIYIYMSVSFIHKCLFICASKGFVIWFAGVCNGTGKIEVRIGGGLVF